MTDLARLLKLSLIIPKEHHQYFRILLAKGLSIDILEKLFTKEKS